MQKGTVLFFLKLVQKGTVLFFLKLGPSPFCSEQEASDEDVDNKYGKEILSETNDLCGRRDNLVSEPIE